MFYAFFLPRWAVFCWSIWVSLQLGYAAIIESEPKNLLGEKIRVKSAKDNTINLPSASSNITPIHDEPYSDNHSPRVYKSWGHGLVV